MQPGSLNKNNPESLKAVEALNSVKRREESKVSSIIAGRRVLNSPRCISGRDDINVRQQQIVTRGFHVGSWVVKSYKQKCT